MIDGSERDEIFAGILEVTRRKALVRARDSALEDSMKYGKLPQQDYLEMKRRNALELESMNCQIDDVLDSLSEPYFSAALKAENMLDRKKTSYVFALQDASSAMKEDLERTRELLEKESMEKADLRKRLDSFINKRDSTEDSYRRKMLDMEKSKSFSPSACDDKLEKTREKMEDYYHKNLLFDLLVKRYGKHIEESEAKTIQDLKNMIQPADPVVVDLASRAKKEIINYDLKHAAKAAENAYKYVCEQIHSVPSLGVNFWMTPKEIMDNGVADYEDKAILLCSVFKNLGIDSSIIIVSLEDGSNRPLVCAKLMGTDLVCDPNEYHDFTTFAGPRDETLRGYSANSIPFAKILYEFDEKEYKEY